MINQLRLFKYNLKQYLRFIGDSFWLLKKTIKYNTSVNTERDIQKMQYSIMRENHVIEKGLSMRNTKKGFGVRKVTLLTEKLYRYYMKYGSIDTEFLLYPLSTIAHYIDYTKQTSDANIDNIVELHNKLINLTGLEPVEKAGVFIENKEIINAEAKRDFEHLLYSRHSLRYFTEKIPDNEIIDKALKLASRTPSACNRQGWKTYIYKGEDCHKLLKWQGGAHGFEEDINCAILVTANLKAFLGHEMFQAYIDGGLYSMNLINALHFIGLGSIPLSCGFNHKKLDQLKEFKIPENEVPIVIIGFGYLPDEFKVAESTRRTIDKTNKYIKL